MMDEGDGFAKDELENPLKDEAQYPVANIVPVPRALQRRELGFHKRRDDQYFEQWGEESFINSQKSLLKCQLPGVPKSTFLMVFSPDGTKAASTHGDHNIYVTDIRNGKCICTLKGHPRTPWSVAFHPSSNEIIASGCLDGQVRVWDLKGGSEVWTPEKKHVIASLAFHPSDQILVIATDHELYFWDWFCPKPFAKISTGSIREKVKYVKFDPLGYRLITGITNSRNERHRFEPLNMSTSSGGPSRMSSSTSRTATGWSSRVTRFMDRYRSRFDRRDPPTQDSANQTGTAAASESSNAQESSFARIIREMNERRAAQGLLPDPLEPVLLDFRNISRQNRTSTTGPLAEEEHRHEPRHPVARPISDDSASSSSLDSSSSVTSGVSGASHERNTRLSLLWTSRLNRTGNDSDNSLGGDYDLEERRGEGSVIRNNRDIRESRRNGRDTPESRRTGLDTPESRRTGRDTPESRRTGRDTPESRRTGRDTPESRRTGRDTPESRRTGRDTPESRRTGRDTPESRRTARDTPDSRRIRRDTPDSRRAVRDLADPRRNTLDIPEPRRDEPHDSRPLDSESPENRRIDIFNRLRELRHRFNRLCRCPDLLPDAADSDSSLPRSGGQGGRWMYYRGKFHGRTAAGPSRRDPSLASLNNPDPLVTAGPSGISSAPSSSSTSSLPASNSQSFQRYRNQSILDPHFGVQLLIRHIENMQRICRLLPLSYRSLSTTRSSNTDLTNHRSEINRSQQIRSMLFDIQRQIRSIRSSVDQTISEEFPSTGSELPSTGGELPSTGGELPSTSAGLPPLDSAMPEEEPPISFSTLQEEDPDQLASALLPNLGNDSSVPSSAESASVRRSTARTASRLVPRARHLSRLQRPSLGLSSRIRPCRHRISWMVRRMLSQRRSDRSRMARGTLNSDEVQITRTSVGLNEPRSRASTRRISSAADREPRRRSLSTRRAISFSQGESSSQVRQRHSGDWQRRIRCSAAHQNSPRSPATATSSSNTTSTLASSNTTSTSASSNTTLILGASNTTSTPGASTTTSTSASNQSMTSRVQETLNSVIEDLESLPHAISSQDPPPLSPYEQNSPLREPTRVWFRRNQSPRGGPSTSSPRYSSAVAGLMEEERQFYLDIQEQVNQLSEVINGTNLDGDDNSSSSIPSRPPPPPLSNADELLNLSSSNREPGPPPLPPLLDDLIDYDVDLDPFPLLEPPVRAAPPTTSLTTRIAAMLDEEIPRRSTTNDRAPTTAAQESQGARPRPPRSVAGGSRRRPSPSASSSYWSSGLGPGEPSAEDDDFLMPDESGFDRRPFLQNLRALRREILQTHRHRLLNRRNTLVTGRDLAGATLDALDSERERFRAERRDRYRVILERMAERLNRLMNRSLLTHVHNLQQEIEQEFVELSGEASNIPSRNSSSVTAALDSHMHNLRLLVRLALQLIHQLLNFICNQNIDRSYEERPISRLPNPFRDDVDNQADLSLDMELEPGLRNLTNLLETVRMASVELRNEVMEGTSSRTSGRPLSSAVSRRLTYFLYRDYVPPDVSHLMLPRSLVIPQYLLNDGSMEGGAGGPSAASGGSPEINSGGPSSSLDSPQEDLMFNGFHHPLRVLERQNAVDRLSPEPEEAPPENEGPSNTPWSFFSHERPFASMGRHPFRPIPASVNPLNNNYDPDQSPEQSLYFNHYVAARNNAVRFQNSVSPLLSGSANPTHRIQAWDFTQFQLPDISDSLINIVVPKCKIHFDASVSISEDGNLLAALIPEQQPITRVSVYSLEPNTLGQILFSNVMDSNTICVSISPTMKHLVVGIASYNQRLGVLPSNNEKQVVASVYKIRDNLTGRNQPLEFVRHISLERDHRLVSLNCIRWMPFAGQGLIYGTNRGQLTILR